MGCRLGSGSELGRLGKLRGEKGDGKGAKGATPGNGNGGNNPGIGSGRGPGYGPDIKTGMDPYKTKPEGKLSKGKAMKLFFKGKPTKGELTTEYEEAYRAQVESAEDALSRDDIPAGYKQFVRDYFDSIKPTSKKD